MDSGASTGRNCCCCGAKKHCSSASSEQEAASSFFLLRPCSHPLLPHWHRLRKSQVAMRNVAGRIPALKAHTEKGGLGLRNTHLTDKSHMKNVASKTVTSYCALPTWLNDSLIICIESRTPVIVRHINISCATKKK